MQLGSGSYELKPSLTYNGVWRGWRVGGQANATMRLDDNDENYRLGDKFELQGWAMKNLAPYASASLRLDASYQGKLDGQDIHITLPVPTAQSRSSGGTYANLSIGINLIGQSGVLRDHRLAVDLVWPVHQVVLGLQMQRQETLTLGWQRASKLKNAAHRFNYCAPAYRHRPELPRRSQLAAGKHKDSDTRHFFRLYIAPARYRCSNLARREWPR